MIRAYHLVPRDIAETVTRHAKDWHWLDLPDGSVLLSTLFVNDVEQEQFEKHVTVERLPHLFDSTPIDSKHVPRLSHLGVIHGHTTRDVRRLAKKIHRLI